MISRGGVSEQHSNIKRERSVDDYIEREEITESFRPGINQVLIANTYSIPVQGNSDQGKSLTNSDQTGSNLPKSNYDQRDIMAKSMPTDEATLRVLKASLLDRRRSLLTEERELATRLRLLRNELRQNDVDLEKVEIWLGEDEDEDYERNGVKSEYK